MDEKYKKYYEEGKAALIQGKYTSCPYYAFQTQNEEIYWQSGYEEEVMKLYPEDKIKEFKAKISALEEEYGFSFADKWVTTVEGPGFSACDD